MEAAPLAPIQVSASRNPGWASTLACKIRTGASSAKTSGTAICTGLNTPTWAHGTWTRPPGKILLGRAVCPQKEQGLEEEIGRYLQNHISFALFRIAEKEERLRLEPRIISTVRHAAPRAAGWAPTAPRRKPAAAAFGR